jgi:DNA-binding NtrC family response regulator
LEEVKAGNFREDLYYRLMGLRIDLPTLRERGNDIILLAKTFAVDFCKDNGMPKKDFSPAALEKLMKYNYPGNVRELKSIAEIAVVMSEGNQIQADDVQFNQRHLVEDFLQEELTLEEYNTRIIKWYLQRYNNNVLKVADKLDVGKSTIYRMMKEGKI